MVSGWDEIINAEPIVWHEPCLDEYWDKLEAAIDQNKQLGIVTNIEDIYIENSEITKDRLAALAEIFHSGRGDYTSVEVSGSQSRVVGIPHRPQSN
jgi:glutamate mutase epsilon subunit